MILAGDGRAAAAIVRWRAASGERPQLSKRMGLRLVAADDVALPHVSDRRNDDPAIYRRIVIYSKRKWRTHVFCSRTGGRWHLD
jgi:hypothetical protein